MRVVTAEDLKVLYEADRCGALRPGDVMDPTASVKHALRALARRWRTLAAEIDEHDELLDIITRAAVPILREAYGIGPDAATEMMSVADDNPTRIRSEAAFAKLCGACPIPASSGVTNRHRLFRGGHRQADAALYRIVIVRMRWHQPTIEYGPRRTAEGRSKRDVIRCLKRFVAREIYPRAHRRPPGRRGLGGRRLIRLHPWRPGSRSLGHGGKNRPFALRPYPAIPPRRALGHPQGRSGAEEPRFARLDPTLPDVRRGAAPAPASTGSRGTTHSRAF